MFEKEKYYKLIKDLEKIVTIIYVLILIFSVIIGLIGGGVSLIITIPIGLLVAFLYTITMKIKIQEMRFQMDIYYKINKIVNK